MQASPAVIWRARRRIDDEFDYTHRNWDYCVWSYSYIPMILETSNLPRLCVNTNFSLSSKVHQWRGQEISFNCNYEYFPKKQHSTRARDVNQIVAPSCSFSFIIQGLGPFTSNFKGPNKFICKQVTGYWGVGLSVSISGKRSQLMKVPEIRDKVFVDTLSD